MKLLEKIIINLIEEELNIINSPVIYFDMDGVLADFDSAVNSNYETQEARNNYLKILKNFPNFIGLSDDEIGEILRGYQNDPGMKALKKAFTIYKEKKYQTAQKPGFFLGLSVLPGAREMLSRAAALTGRKPAILTSPIESNKQCEEEKRQWAEKNLGGLFDRFICSKNKHEYANSNSILIDDRTKYTSKFEANGGIAILHKNPTDTLQKLENILKFKGNIN